MSATFWKVFELAISVLENMLLSVSYTHLTLPTMRNV